MNEAATLWAVQLPIGPNLARAPRAALTGSTHHESRMLSEVFQNYQILPLQRSFEGRRINISMTHHLFPLVADMLADFILYLASDELRQSPDDPLVRAKARRAVDLFWLLLQAALAKHGHAVSLHALQFPCGDLGNEDAEFYRIAGAGITCCDIVQHRDRHRIAGAVVDEPADVWLMFEAIDRTRPTYSQ